MRVTPDRLDVAEAALEAYAEHLMQYGRAALPPRNDLRRVIEAIPDTTEPAPDVRPKWCNVHQHHKWCEHNGGVMGPTGYAAPDEQAQIDAAVKAYRQDMHECEQIAGRALGYPRYCDDQRNFPDATDADGVCVGEHVAPTIVAELAEKYRAAMSENEHWRTTAKDRISTALADEMVREAVAREREECARVAEWVWDSGNQGAHGGEQANRTTAAIRARSAKGVS